MTAFLWIYLLIGPALVLAGWIWLRSRREPVSLIERMEIGRVLSGAFGAFAEWRVVLMAIFIVGSSRALAMETVHLIVPPMVAGLMPNQRVGAGALIGGGVGLIDYLVTMIFYVPAAYGLVRTYSGEAEPWQGAAGATARRLLPMVAISVLGMIGGFLGALLFIVPAFILILNWAVILPVAVIEGAGVFTTFGRSRELAIGSRGRMLLAYLVVLAVVVVMMAVIGIVQRLLPHTFGVRLGVQILTGIVTAILGVGLQSSLYVELRRIRDGLSAPGLAEVFA